MRLYFVLTHPFFLKLIIIIIIEIHTNVWSVVWNITKEGGAEFLSYRRLQRILLMQLLGGMGM